MTLPLLPCACCGTVQPLDHNFCSHCGAALRTSPCPTCGAPTPSANDICERCGSLLREQGRPPLSDQNGEHKFVTAFFVDIKGSVALLNDRDIEEGRHIIDAVILHISSLITRHEGTVIDAVGDGVFALFGAPRSLDGHPRAAVNAAMEIQDSMRANKGSNALFSELQLRIGIDTGDVIWRVLQVGRERRHLPVGPCVNQASRLQELAEPGSVWIGETTHDLVKDYFVFSPQKDLRLKGIPRSVNAYKLLKSSDVFLNLQVSMKRGLSPFVGRDHELSTITESIRNLERGRGNVLVLVAEAGAGKSRLLYEATKALGPEICLIEAFCISYMQSSPWYSVVQLVRDLLAIPPGLSPSEAKLQVKIAIRALDPVLEADLPTLFEFLDLDARPVIVADTDPTVRQQKYISLVLKLLALKAKSCPLIVMIEDLHWLDLQSAGVVDAIWSTTEQNPILLLCTTRPEGVKAAWRTHSHSILSLRNLDASAARHLMRSLVSTARLDERVVQDILDKTQGNPFFIEEVIRSLPLAQATSARNSESVLDTMAMPSTIKMAIADRIDRLPQLEKTYLQILAVVGSRCKVSFFAQFVAEEYDEIVLILLRLQELGFLLQSGRGHDVDVQFAHVLIQDVAYSSLLSERRASLHERIADTILAGSGQVTSEILPDLAHHYQHSCNDGKAVEYLRLAGEFAIQRSAHQEAQNYLKRGLARLDCSPRLPDKLFYLAQLWLSLGVSLQVTLGYAADAVRQAYENAVEYSEKAQAPNLLLASLRGYGIFNIVKANYGEAAKIANRLKDSAKGDPTFALEHLILNGLSYSYRGELAKGAEYYRQGLLVTVQPETTTTIQYSGYSPGICYSYYALNALFSGQLCLAKEYAVTGLDLASASGISVAVAQSRGMLGHVLFCLGDFQEADAHNQANIGFAQEHGFAYWSLLGRLLTTWTNGRLRNDAASLDEFEFYVSAYRSSGALIGVPWFLNLYAELLWRFDRCQEALVVLGEAEGLASLTQERFFLVDTLRLKGELHRALSSASTSVVAMQCFQEAINLANVQGAWLAGMRAAMPLAQLLQRQGELAEARALIQHHCHKMIWIDCALQDEVRSLMRSLSADVCCHPPQA